MAQSKLKINFAQNLIVGSTISFNLKAIDTGIETPVTFTYVLFRANPFEVTAQAPLFGFIGQRSAERFKDAFDLDFPLDFSTEISTTKFSSSVTITSIDENITFAGGLSTYEPGYSSAYITFEITRVDGIFLGGLENNNYLLNNDIWLDLFIAEEIDRYELNISNSSNGNITPHFELYSYNNKASVNLSPVFKFLFDKVESNNYNRFRVNVKAFLNDVLIKESTTYETIIRGGKRTEKTNIFLPTSTVLRPSLNLPIWNGYPTNEYYIADDNTIQIKPIQDVLNKDFKRFKNCDSLYFKFTNQYGGVSNWLFESYQELENNKPLGATSVGRNITDMGNESESSLQVFSKVSAEYYGLIKDLIISPYILIWKNNEWVRVFSSRNSTEDDNNKRAYSVKLKFDFENRFNPSALWSN